jgi:hypothetical protein
MAVSAPLLDELKERFGVRHVLGRGPCVVIPRGQWNVIWEEGLRGLGVAFEFNVDLPGGDRCTVVRLQAEKLGEKVVFEPPGEEAGLRRVLKGKDTPLGPAWTEDDYKLLIKLWNKKLKVREIAEKFPGRSGHAVAAAVARLKLSGVVKPRWVCKRRSKREIVEPLTPQPSVPTPIDASVPVAGPEPAEKRQPLVPSISTVVNIDVHCDCSNKEAVENLLRFLKEVRG